MKASYGFCHCSILSYRDPAGVAFCSSLISRSFLKTKDDIRSLGS